MKAKSTIKINRTRIRELNSAAITALEKTAEALHTEIVQAQVVPRDTGHLQNEAFFVDYSQSKSGIATLTHSTPYARRLYYHPEYDFQKTENSNAKGEWFEDWLPGGSKSSWSGETFAEFYRRIAKT